MSLGRSSVELLLRRPSVVDAMVALALGAAFVVLPLVAGEHLRTARGIDLDLTGADVAVTVVSALALTQVRRRPPAVLVVTATAGLVSIVGGWQVNLAQMGVGVALFAYALERSRKQALVAASITSLVLGAATVVIAGLWRDQWGQQDVILWLWTATAAGVAVSSKRAAMAALEDRARRAEETREETARRRVAEDRVRIARELHDVIAHHVAVMSVQSGVAEHLVERDPAAAREALHRVRAAAKSVLSELQSVLGVRRQDESVLPTTPAPGLTHVAGLVEPFRAMGSSVELVVPERLPGLSPTAGVAAFRLVQEALTNVQKHATGASATVTWSTDGDEVEIAVTNARPPSEHPHSLHAPPAGSGLGLVGMLERVLAAGGSLVSGSTADGGFRVAARLPLTQEDS
jgi:signal transduction histidine kinase